MFRKFALFVVAAMLGMFLTESAHAGEVPVTLVNPTSVQIQYHIFPGQVPPTIYSIDAGTTRKLVLHEGQVVSFRVTGDTAWCGQAIVPQSSLIDVPMPIIWTLGISGGRFVGVIQSPG